MLHVVLLDLFLNTTERSMSLLNIGLFGLSLQSVIEVSNEFLTNEGLVEASSMIVVR